MALALDVRRHLGDAPVDDGDVGLPARRAGAVDDEPPSEHQVVHHAQPATPPLEPAARTVPHGTDPAAGSGDVEAPYPGGVAPEDQAHFYDEATERRIEAAADGPPRPPIGGRTAGWPGSARRRAWARVLTGIAMGLQEVFYPEEDEIAMVVDADGEPDLDHPVILDFDPTSPPATSADARPWLLDGES